MTGIANKHSSILTYVARETKIHSDEEGSNNLTLYGTYVLWALASDYEYWYIF